MVKGKRSSYKTKQKESILLFLQSSGENSVTVNDIAEHLLAAGYDIGVTTIYRYLNTLIEEGLVNKFPAVDGSSALFHYKEDENHCLDHFHFKCESCSTLIHIDCHALSDVETHLERKHGLTVNHLKTVFYGLCKRCNV